MKNLSKKPFVFKNIFYRKEKINEKEFLVFDYSTAIGFLTNAFGMWIISQCNGSRSVNEIIKNSFIKYDSVNKNVIKKDVLSFLYELGKNKIIGFK